MDVGELCTTCVTGVGEYTVGGGVDSCLLDELTSIIIPMTIIAVITNGACSVCIAGSSLPNNAAAIGKMMKIIPSSLLPALF